jgi:hypothetical protein
MSTTGTRTALFTITEARYVGAKIGADLRLLNGFYGAPAIGDIDDYVEEVAILLRDGYLGTVSYGFREASTNDWKLRLRYTATAGGRLTDGRPGSLPATTVIAGCPFYSYMTYSPKFIDLTTAKQADIKETLPVSRVGAEEPGARLGTTGFGNGYSRNGVGVTRDVYTAA